MCKVNCGALHEGIITKTCVILPIIGEIPCLSRVYLPIIVVDYTFSDTKYNFLPHIVTNMTLPYCTQVIP